MNEKKIAIIIGVIVAVLYIGIEPLAHAVMHPIPPVDYEYSDLENNSRSGDAKKGQQLVRAHCSMCHSVEVDLGAAPVSRKALKREFGAMFDEDSEASYQKYLALYQSKQFGVVPLDLSNVGRIYHNKFLASFIKRPAHTAFEATYMKHAQKKFEQKLATLKTDQEREAFVAEQFKAQNDYKERKKISMPNFTKLSDQQIADIMSYLNLISRDLTPKETTELACGRCHSVRLGGIQAGTDADELKRHFGTVPPDLSMMFKSKGAGYLHAFINDPQSIILGSKMPRAGLDRQNQQKVIDYLEQVADPKKEERLTVAWWVMGYFVIFALVTYAWYRNEKERITEKE